MSNNRKEQLLELFQNNNGSDLSDAELLETLFLIVNPHSDSKRTEAEPWDTAGLPGFCTAITPKSRN